MSPFCRSPRIESLSCPSLISYRGLSTSSGNDDGTVFTAGDPTHPVSDTPSFQESMSKLIPTYSSPITPENEVVNASVAAADAASTAASSGLPWDPTWYNTADQAINAVLAVHDVTGLEYGLSIVALTTAVRVGLFPFFVTAQRNSSRMAHMKPEMDALKAKMENLGTTVDQEMQLRMANQMKGLFKKYGCNPLKALMLPVVQAPIFMSMFFGLRKMPDYFPDELATGGMLWFPDLTLPDPYYILPVASSLSFIAMIELGKEAMLANNAQQGQIFLNVFRAMGVVIIPVTLNFSTAIFCYWMTNNTISLVQSAAFRNQNVRKALGIWDPPKPVPGQEPKGIIESIQDAVKTKPPSQAEQIKAHNEAIDNQKKFAAVRGEGGTGGGRTRRRGRNRRK